MKDHMQTNFNGHAAALNITNDWSKKKANLKKMFSQLTDDDLKFESGEELNLLRSVENRLNKEREWVVRMIRNA